MKYIIAVIQPDRLDPVMEELEKRGIHYVTVTPQVLGRGRQKGEALVYRGHKEMGSLLRKVKVEIAVNDEYVEKAIDAINVGAKSDQIGDGKIFVFDLEQCVRIHTGETGNVAIG